MSKVPEAPRHESPALVIGLTIHGLAVARALARQGVEVHCLSDVSEPRLPATFTRFAKVHFRAGLNSDRLESFLHEMADELGTARKIVLFPTSDRISKTIANAWDRLRDRYLLSWAHCRELVLELQRKDSLAAYCERAGIRYPKSRLLGNAQDVPSIARELQFPVVIKPAQPLSSFKAIQIQQASELARCTDQYAHDLPFVVQEWVEGPEPSLYSCTSYLDKGRPLHLFTSRKIAASPPRTGQGTVFETAEDSQIRTASEKFISELDLSGPIAIEFKKDAAGQYWFIEPNVGRTEYCVDLAIQSGFNLPYMEYLHVTNGSPVHALSTVSRECAWFDTDKDPACFLANLGPVLNGRTAIFPFLGHEDLRPLWVSVSQQAARAVASIGRRIGRMLGRSRRHD